MKLSRWAVVVWLAASVWAQENPSAPPVPAVAPKPRPRIGLVLEGGGALGFAHVGVIDWLQQNHIPVDVVAGTSMGAVIGGIFATGESPAEIKRLIHGIDWIEVLRGQTDYRDLSFRRKQDRRDYPNAFEFGLKEKTQFPSGFNSGQQVGLILDRVGLPYSSLASFDDLPIPFRCVAADLVSGKPYVFDRGSLAEALRSTMSIPAFFSPVRDGRHIFVDGGLVDNLPVDVARQMGADIVIAVHLPTKPTRPDEAASSLGVLQKAVSVTIAANELRSMEKADILITAAVEDYSATDYEQYEAIEAAGYKAAQEKSALLSALRVSDSEWQELEAARAAKKRQSPVPEFVEVRGPKGYIARGLRHNLGDVVGVPVDTEHMDEKMMSITGLGRFSWAGYQMVQRNGQAGLEVTAEEKDYAPPTVHPLLFINGADYKNVLFQVGARITFLDLGGFGSEWRSDFTAGSEYGLTTEYYHPFTAFTHWFAALQGVADSSPFNVYQHDRILTQYRNRRVGGRFDLGYAFGKSSELRLGYEVGFQKVSTELGNPVVAPVRGRYGATSVRYTLDRFDNPVIPRSGVRLESTFKFFDANPGAQDKFPSEQLRVGWAEPTSERSSFLFFASGGTTFSSREVGFPPFTLGGPLRLGAYGTNELLTSQYFLFQPGYLYRLHDISPLLGQHLYLYSAYEIGKAYYQTSAVSKLPQNGTLGILVQTVFGPIFFGGSIGDSGHRKFYFQSGRFF